MAVRLATVAACVAACALLMAVPALADPSQTGFFSTIKGDLSAFTPNRLAVDEATGDVYVIDSADQLVERYSASGTRLGELVGATTPAGRFEFGGLDDDIAVDNSGGPNQGDVYVVGENNGGPGLVTAYDATGRFLWQYAPANDYPPGVTDTIGVAVDPSGNLWTADYNQGVQQRSVADGSPIGSLVDRTGDSSEIAFDSTGVFYLTHYQGSLSKYTPTLTGTPTSIDSGPNRDVSTDSVYDDVYTSHGSAIAAYDSSANPLPGTPFGSNILGVTVDGAHGTIFASDPTDQTVQIWTRGKGSPKPYARLADASNVTGTSATLNATVNPAGDTTTCMFEYGTTTSYGSSAPCASDPGNGTSDVGVSADVTGLSGGTTYYYRVIASNSAGGVPSSTGTFSTLAPPHTVTVVVNGTAGGRVDADSGAIAGCTSSGGTCSDSYNQGTTLQLTGTPDAHAHVTSMSVTSGNAAPTTCTSPSVTNPCSVTVNEDLTVTVTFDTIQHTVTVAKTGSTGTGTVTSAPAGISCGSTCNALFDEGSSPTLTAAASTGSTFTGWSGGGCSGTSDCSPTVNADVTVTAVFALNPPVATTGSASGVGQTAATLGGSVNPNGNATSCHFDYGTTAAYGSTAPCASSPGSGSSPVGVSASLSGLAAGATYHYRLVASNGTQTVAGSDATFSTSTPPPPPPPPPGCPQDLSKCPPPSLAFAGFTSKTLVLKLRCTGSAGQTCSGKLTFKAVIKVRVKHGKKTKVVKKTITVATVSYSVGAGSTASVKLKLTSAAKSALKTAGLTARAKGLNGTIKLPKTKARKPKKKH